MNATPKSFRLVLLLLCISTFLLAGCLTPPTEGPQPGIPKITHAPQVQATQTAVPPTSTPTPAPNFDLHALDGFEFILPDLETWMPDSRGRVRLEAGADGYAYRDAASGVTVQLYWLTPGYLDGDEQVDAAAVLSVDTGGSGRFVYLVALLDQGDGLRQAGLAFLEDRVQVQQVSIQDGVIQLERSTHAPQDPLCCPSLEINEAYTLAGDLLVLAELSPVVEAAELTMRALRERDLQTLATVTHPELGVRFSPYAFVRQEDRVFTPEQIAALDRDPEVYAWGYFDGSGEPIQMSFPDYYERFIYSKDFANADQIGVSRSGDPHARRLGVGNSMDNSLDFFGKVVVVEYYMKPENPDYGGLDWQSLRLVFQKEDPACEGRDCTWYLVGVIHDEWTI